VSNVCGGYIWTLKVSHSTVVWGGVGVGGGGRKNVWQVGNVQSVTELCLVPVTVQTELLRVLTVFVVHIMVNFRFLHLEDRGRDSSVVIAIATGWMVRGSNPGGDEFFRTRSDLPSGPPSLLYSG
jgi:hypothetical protein